MGHGRDRTVRGYPRGRSDVHWETDRPICVDYSLRPWCCVESGAPTLHGALAMRYLGSGVGQAGHVRKGSRLCGCRWYPHDAVQRSLLPLSGGEPRGVACLNLGQLTVADSSADSEDRGYGVIGVGYGCRAVADRDRPLLQGKTEALTKPGTTLLHMENFPLIHSYLQNLEKFFYHEFVSQAPNPSQKHAQVVQPQALFAKPIFQLASPIYGGAVICSSSPVQ